MSTAERRILSANSVALSVIATIALLYFLRSASQLLIPIVLGVLVSYALEPVVAWLERHHLPRLAGTSLVLLALLVPLGWGAYSVRDNVQSAIAAIPTLTQKARALLERTPLGSAKQPDGTGSRGEAPQSRTRANAPQTPLSGGQQAAAQPPSADPQGSGASAGSGGPLPESMSMTGLVQQGVSSAFTLAGHLMVIVFLVFFLLLSGHHVRDRLVEVSGPDAGNRRTTAKILDDINAQIQRFLLVRLVTAALVALLTWAVLAWMGVENAVIWGLLAGVFNSIPYFGPVIVAGGLLVVGIVQEDGFVRALQMSGAALAITSVEGWLLTPPLMGKAERMSALAVFLGLLLWTWVWGAWGTILAVPMLVVIKSAADHVERLRPIGRLMAP